VKVSLFITCLVDEFFPQVGKAMVQVLEGLGIQVDFPAGQTCCGQPAFNMGHHGDACRAAERYLHLFRNSEVVVAPSGSCIAMLRHHYPLLFAEDFARKTEADALAARSYEFSEFLVRILKTEDVGACFPHKVTYHDSCHLLRMLGIREEPRKLIRAVRGIELVEMNDSNVCCGFGGAFSIKLPHLSTAMMEDKLANIQASGAKYLIAADSGCLMNIGGGATRRNLPVQAMHLIELLACRQG
jgi:L-lactate dehydrogenase complex protein LldE